jgi:hypothetical protein
VFTKLKSESKCGDIFCHICFDFSHFGEISCQKKSEHLVSLGSASCIFILECQNFENLKNGAVVCVCGASLVFKKFNI